MTHACWFEYRIKMKSYLSSNCIQTSLWVILMKIKTAGVNGVIYYHRVGRLYEQIWTCPYITRSYKSLRKYIIILRLLFYISKKPRMFMKVAVYAKTLYYTYEKYSLSLPDLNEHSLNIILLPWLTQICSIICSAQVHNISFRWVSLWPLPIHQWYMATSFKLWKTSFFRVICMPSKTRLTFCQSGHALWLKFQ